MPDLSLAEHDFTTDDLTTHDLTAQALADGAKAQRCEQNISRCPKTCIDMPYSWLRLIPSFK